MLDVLHSPVKNATLICPFFSGALGSATLGHQEKWADITYVAFHLLVCVSRYHIPVMLYLLKDLYKMQSKIFIFISVLSCIVLESSKLDTYSHSKPLMIFSEVHLTGIGRPHSTDVLNGGFSNPGFLVQSADCIAF